MAGYSKTHLSQKLGLKEGMSVFFYNERPSYHALLEQLPNDVTVNKSQEKLDFIQYFTKEKKELEKVFPKLKQSLKYSGMLWISWPKAASGVAIDINENLVRDIGLKNGLVDVKVIAIDEIWSGLKFVYRLMDRK